MSTFYEVLLDAVDDAVEVLDLDVSQTEADALVLRVGESVIKWLEQGFNGSEP